jgi:hypothetical protein
MCHAAKSKDLEYYPEPRMNDVMTAAISHFSVGERAPGERD